MNGISLNDIVTFSRACESGGTCVEVGKMELYAIRDSKNPDGSVLVFDTSEWAVFVRAVKAGEFDLL